MAEDRNEARRLWHQLVRDRAKYKGELRRILKLFKGIETDQVLLDRKSWVAYLDGMLGQED